MVITNETPAVGDHPMPFSRYQLAIGEDQQQQVTGEHVGEQSHRVGERPDQQVREELDDHDQRQHRAERLVVAGDVLEAADEAVPLEGQR